jgi:PAS domain S-box-containing protein
VSTGSARVERLEIAAGTGVSFSDVRIARRVLPFAVAAALPFLLTLPFGPSTGSADLVASGILTALLTVVSLAVPWTRLPVPLRATVPAYFASVFLLLDSSAAAAAVYTPLVLLPVIWLALYGTRTQLIAAFLLLALTLILPIMVFGAPRYPATQWRRVAIYPVIAPIVGVTIQRLMTATRERADRLRASEAAIRATRDLLASVLRASTEYAIIGTDPGGVITVFNAGAERMLGYSATEMIAAQTPEILLDPTQLARRARELDMAPGFGVLVAAARRGQPCTLDWSYIRRDGERPTVSLTVTAIDRPGVSRPGSSASGAT